MKKLSKPIYLLVILALVFGILGSATAQAPAVTRAHPALIAIAASEPGQMVRVIVQKSAAAGRTEQLAEALGGKITKDLSIIKAFAVDLPAAAALKLSASPGVRWVSLDAPVERSGQGTVDPLAYTTNYYLDTLGVKKVWALKVKGNPVNGKGVGVAIIDSGVSADKDITRAFQYGFSANSHTVNDVYGHGTHVAGIVASTGVDSAGAYKGVAPGVTLISLKVSDESGMAYESDVVAALQWVYDNKNQHNLRVVNISLNSTIEQSYHTSPLDAAVEILWFNGVVVVVSVGNKGAGTYNTANASPANDPFVITVGATDEKASTRRTDDVVASFTARGKTSDGFNKPDILAPGTNIISVLSKTSPWGAQYPERVVLNGEYFTLSGTSMAAPMVAGTVALLLQDEPGLTPDQVKYRLLSTASNLAEASTNANYKYLNAYSAVTGTSKQSANTGLTASQLLWSGSEPITWGSVAWNSVSWSSVAWNSVSWNSLAWNSVSWEAVSWNGGGKRK
ncbi:MAG TPA: S8 family peptidase [Anaerolineales bacterium]|nr:S8 family peptidase [Anaerolineales bacterium]